MLRHRFGADYQALGKRSFYTREDFPVVPGMEEDDFWALWERMRQGDSYDELRQLLIKEGVDTEHIKPVMQWLEDQALRYFPLLQQYRTARAWVYAGLVIMVGGAAIAYFALQAGYRGFLPLFPFQAGTAVFILNWSKFRSLRREVNG